jgi:hypothetical protein
MGLGVQGRFPDSRIILLPAFPSSLGEQWRLLEVVPDYSSGGCVRISRTSLHLKPKNSIVKEIKRLYILTCLTFCQERLMF